MKNPNKGRTCVFPGSFNPFTLGHKEVVEKALQVFDRVIVAKGINPAKYNDLAVWNVKLPKGAEYVEFTGLVVDLVNRLGADAVVKGLRNATDLEYETSQQYWNEDLGLAVPIYYVISGRDKRHISSSAIRQLSKFKKNVSK